MDENQDETSKYKVQKRLKKIFKKEAAIRGKKKYKKNKEMGVCSGLNRNQNADKDRKYVCSICKKKQYKYRRNKLRHEKYECVTGPQFSCGTCGKKYSQKKTLTSHIVQKHPDWALDVQIHNA
ncbi:unnamed protein product [Parnassius apollo]|uniref:(apollo) hypothetical protein n=1 Tax=Parnassius apollo TaxID=110799 RepID=A0A8S3WIK6_PARAO|nr:unnamed protein product [Parnassius apollo]